MSATPVYRPELDSFRAYAVVLVLLSHWVPDARFVAAFNWGLAGVYVFFVISGFVITRILLVASDGDTGWHHAAGKFYLRRILRIWPIYYLTCVVAFFIWPRIDSGYAAWHFLFASNVLDGLLGKLSHPVHFWSLSVEQQFYLAWPFLVFLLSRRHLALVCVAGMVVAPACRYLFLVHYDNLPLMVTSTPSNVDVLAAGALLALAEEHRHRLVTPRAIDRACDVAGLLGAALLLWIIQQRLAGHPQAGFIGGATAFALISLWLVRRARDFALLRGVLHNPATIFVGTISYGVYIYHLFVGMALAALVPGLNGSYAFVAVATALTLLVATASWYFIEKPILKVKVRLN